MYQLTIVAGPGRGTSFALREGENAIGRLGDGSVVLSSSRVSKRHCVLILLAGRMVLRDESRNGTFVNGTMVKERELQVGDRISVGEFVLQVGRASARSAKRRAKAAAVNPAAIAGWSGGNVIPMPRSGGEAAGAGLPAVAGNLALAMDGGDPAPAVSGDPLVAGATMPQDLPGRALWLFEKRVMPLFYRLQLKSEWRHLGVLLVGGALAVGLLLVLQPVLDSGRSTLLSEVGRRTRFMAQQIADQNAGLVQSGALSQVRVDSYRSDLGVRIAALLTLEDNRVLASNLEIPGGYLTQGAEGRTAVVVSKAVIDGQLSGAFVKALENDLVVAAVPVEVFDPRLGRNVPRALALVSVDASLYTRGSGEVGIVYGQALVVLAVILGLALLVLYRMTLKPFEVLNEEMDQVLKGRLSGITHEFRWSEMDPIWELIQATLQRVPKGGTPGDSGADLDQNPAAAAEEALSVVRMLGDSIKAGIVLCDSERKVVYINPAFEDSSGIRGDSALGQELASVARDQAFGALATDLFERAQPGSLPLGEDFDFSGVSFRMQVAAFGTPGSAARAYLMIAVRNDG